MMVPCVPSRSTNPATSFVSKSGETAPSIGNALPPQLSRRSTTKPHVSASASATSPSTPARAYSSAS
ncbi:hypothetical protein ACFPRL_17155 [Pseudoclavibacter helvolus]